MNIPFFLLLFFAVAFPVSADVVRTIAFPVSGEYVFRDDFHEPRGGGTRLHLGNDILAAKMTPLVAVIDGYVNYVARPEASWGYEISLQDGEGYTYSYLHINNDTPGTDDGRGGEANAYVPGVHRGATVSRGQLIGWVGDSGNAENTVPHLHFEIRDPNNEVINPFASLVAAAGGKGVSANIQSTNAVDSLDREQVVSLRYIFTKDLFLDDESSEVRRLQQTLKSFGHFNYPNATGYYGPITRDAVLSYQQKKGIPQTGIVDLATRRKLNDDLGTYDPNDYVPFYSEAEQRAIKIQQLLTLIAKLQAELKILRGY
ncbi:MAG: peptidoglycan DD-metalloendopeptidase family protein [bacterium]|nr:peptidoglycan DD-metalloendopeptidase family protein [bacterium]